MFEAFVYMLRCADGSYYVGSARGDLDRRLSQHHSGELGGYTSTRRPVELVWNENFERIVDAIAFERQVKGWSRAKKEALIRGDYDALPALAKRRASFETAAPRPPQDEGGGRRMKGFFLTLEGGEGAGKSTQAKRLAEHLRAHGKETVLTREPGGSPSAEMLRPVLLTGDAARWTPLAETLLMYAGREDHLVHTIRPALARGAVVICDRFADSTEAYQGAAGGTPPEVIAQLRAAVVQGTEPDLTLIFDLPVETGLARAGARGGEARFESKGAAYHQRLREAFLAIAKREPKRCKLIDAAQPIDTVFANVLTAVENALHAA